MLVPEAAGVLSALGLAVGEERRDHVRSEVRPLDDVADLPAEGEADLRYRGQSFELTVPLGAGLADRFHELHEERYGYADRARDRSSWWRFAPPRCGRARRSTLPAGPRETVSRPGDGRARRRHVLGPPWVGGG